MQAFWGVLCVFFEDTYTRGNYPGKLHITFIIMSLMRGKNMGRHYYGYYMTKKLESALKINNLVHKLRIFYATHSLKLGISVNYFITTTHYLDILMERHTETTKEIKYCNLILI